jgi:EAL domain-containing protein (putative c-di-GMP-specific phosphodiesterase class I)/CheY-like chemotaxis protein
MRLMVLDDDDGISSFVAAVARQRGWSTQVAAEAARFQAMFHAGRPDAIFLDLQLGSSDGVEQLRFLHRAAYAGQVVLMSGFDTRVLAAAQDVGDSLGLAIAAVIEKPARAARVAAVLQQIQRHLSAAAAAAPVVAAAPAPPAARDITPARIAAGIAAGELELHLQPVVVPADRSTRGAECLVRWRHPTAGLVLPEDFIAIAESDQVVIDQLTQWVIEAAATHWRGLAARGLAVRLCVNVSGRNLHSLDFPDQVAAVLARLAVPPDAITLEVTESVAMRDLEATTDILTRLRLKGFGLAIDDFGTGHSSLAALRRMPFSILKIDKSFICDLVRSQDSLIIVTSLIQLARSMGLTSIAEGVESEEVAARLTELGIGGMQGYHFSRPLPFDAFAAWLEARKRPAAPAPAARVWAGRAAPAPVTT